jgi:endo-1,4-beta-xylanase
LFTASVQAETICSNETGSHDGYDYELWKDNEGSACMTLNAGGSYSCEWSDVGNMLCRKGLKFNSTQTHQQIGTISMSYDCNYQPSGNSYLTIYGWTEDPLVEYYIVDSWGSWRPPGASSKGTITIDGGTYEVYETTRTNQPSIHGTATFQQYWSVRTSKRTSGTISVSKHFQTWESMGMNLGKMYEVALAVEGYQSSGNADVYNMSMIIGDSTDETGGTDTDDATR